MPVFCLLNLPKKDKASSDASTSPKFDVATPREYLLFRFRFRLLYAGYDHFVIHNSDIIPHHKKFEGKQWIGRVLDLKQ